jgi:hypothetical protein
MLFGKKTKQIDEILKELDFDKQITVNHEVGRLSDTLCKRDSFFHSCWTRMKYQHPEMFEDMAKIELIIAGYDPDEQPDKKETEDDNENITVL